MIKRILLLLTIYCVFCFDSTAQLLPDFFEKDNKIRIYLANSIVGKGIDTNILNAGKIKPALHYISLLTNRYELVPDSEIEAAFKKLKIENIQEEGYSIRDNKMTAFEIAKEVQADRIFIIKLEQLVNAIRVEIISANPIDNNNVNIGEGIAVLKLFKKSDGMPYFDPTILTALQRAFASVENDSLMFINKEEPYNVKPAPSIVIAGIDFVNDENFTNWELFNNPLINSFEYSEVIYEAIYKNKNWVVFDIESRDAIYALFNLFLIENNVPPNYNELAALRKFNIEHYITGKIERTKNGINIILSIKENKTSSNEIIKLVSKEVFENNISKIRKILEDLANELVNE